MIKSLAKELILFVLTLLLIVLGMLILIYIFSPNRVNIPKAEKYTTSEEYKKELNMANTDSQKEIIQTFLVDDYQLNQYKAVESYIPGKPDPFSPYSSGNIGTDEVTSGETTTQTPDISGTKSEYSNDEGTK